MPLCKVGKTLFNKFQRISSVFATEYAQSDGDVEAQEKIMNELLHSLNSYNLHVSHCIECNMDMKYYKIWWVHTVWGISGEVVGKPYISKQDAERDAKTFDKLYPGLKHFVKETGKNG